MNLLYIIALIELLAIMVYTTIIRFTNPALTETQLFLQFITDPFFIVSLIVFIITSVLAGLSQGDL